MIPPADARFLPAADSRNLSSSHARRRAARPSEFLGGFFRLPTFLLLACGLAMPLAAGLGQMQERKTKLPGLEKITGGPSRQAFSGIVQSLDLKRNLLNVNTVQGGVTEFFPVKKSVHVVTADGDKLRLTALTPGTNVLIYYEQKGDRRTVKQIVVLAAEPSEAKKANPPS